MSDFAYTEDITTTQTSILFQNTQCAASNIFSEGTSGIPFL